MNKQDEFIAPCPVCKHEKMNAAAITWKAQGRDEEYPAYAIICAECGDRTTIGVGSRGKAIKIYNQLPRF